MDLECDVYKQVEAIVNESLLPQECEMKYATKCESTLHNDNPPCSYSDKRRIGGIANSSHLPRNSNSNHSV